MILKQNFFFILLIFGLTNLKAQDKVTFTTQDNLTVVANLYEVDPSYPYIILLHQANYSKGEYKEIAISLLKLKYNCLAVDLRNGGTVNSVPNETINNVKEAGVLSTMYDAKKDVEAAVDFIYKKTNQEVILFGSSYSGSLALIVGEDSPNVKAIIAYSPGEFFRNKILIHDELGGIDKPVYVAGTKTEYDYLKRFTELIPKEFLVLFQPQNNEGKHGAKALWKSEEGSQEYWLSLLMFINNLK